ncbi:hypothetical protein [Pseudomonas entomophila]|uniref:hypothetical protein n=1 Tax=Pseudomonas entomophila TaxID=312306 RepID=UPI0024B0F4EA|nr:hypothetical protein [Pseudomonas entomophila]
MAVIQGTEGADNLVGTAADDQIYGRGGDDVLNGGDGNDILFGGIGADRLIGGAGTDTGLVRGQQLRWRHAEFQDRRAHRPGGGRHLPEHRDLPWLQLRRHLRQ